MLDRYEIVNGKKYRMGYTTGSCAAAASKAAVKMLVSKELVEKIKINTPANIILDLPVANTLMENDSVTCAIIKDGGDDPDITTGLKVFAQARFVYAEGIKIVAGIGIGIVTLPGLKVKIGEPAINPVPMNMILKEVNEVLPKGKGVEILLSIPGGEDIAKKTYNPKLGIVGGISVLGTTGIVKPMSEEAWKDSLALELNVLGSKDIKNIVFTFGNIGEKFAIEKLGIKSENVITISNFVGYMLEKAAEKNFESILFVGHLGKLVKVAAGNFHTHSRVSDGRMETIAAYAALEGASKKTIESIFKCRTTDGACSIIEENELENIYPRIVENVSKKCKEYTFDKIKVGTVLFKENNALLAMDNNAKEIINKIRSSYE